MTKSTECADRYAFSDEYAIQEMALLYRSANTQRRIELLADWNGHAAYWMPFEIARLAVEDPDDGVRYWMARNAKNLDYRDYLRNGRQARGDETHPERDLKARLRADPQPVIRAAVFENSCIYHFVPQDLSSMSHLDRLAYVRNSNVFLLDVIKLAENETIPLSERQEIILAALTNVKFVESSRGGWETNYEHLWDIVSRWPLEYPGAPVEFCRRIHAPALKKAAIYRACQEPYLRKAIIEGCRESDEMTLELGIDDPDADCRKLAFSKVPPLLITKRINTLKKSDQSAVLGLWTNPNLTLEQQDTVGGYVEDWDKATYELRMADVKPRPQPGPFVGTSERYKSYARAAGFGLCVTGLSAVALIGNHGEPQTMVGLLVIIIAGLFPWLLEMDFASARGRGYWNTCLGTMRASRFGRNGIWCGGRI